MVLGKLYSIEFNFKLHLYPIWNRIKFRLKGVTYGKNPKIYNNMFLSLHKGASLNIGNNFVFTSDDCLNPLSRNIKGCIVAYPKATITIGNDVGMSSPCIWAHKSITIGNYVKIGSDCIIMDSDAHSLNYINRRNPHIDKETKTDLPIIIEDDVLIGTRCIILKGVTIGARSVIGSGSVITKSIPSDCIAAGNPCKVIKTIL